MFKINYLFTATTLFFLSCSSDEEKFLRSWPFEHTILFQTSLDSIYYVRDMDDTLIFKSKYIPAFIIYNEDLDQYEHYTANNKITMPDSIYKVEDEKLVSAIESRAIVYYHPYLIYHESDGFRILPSGLFFPNVKTITYSKDNYSEYFRLKYENDSTVFYDVINKKFLNSNYAQIDHLGNIELGNFRNDSLMLNSYPAIKIDKNISHIITLNWFKKEIHKLEIAEKILKHYKNNQLINNIKYSKDEQYDLKFDKYRDLKLEKLTYDFKNQTNKRGFIKGVKRQHITRDYLLTEVVDSLLHIYDDKGKWIKNLFVKPEIYKFNKFPIIMIHDDQYLEIYNFNLDRILIKYEVKTVIGAYEIKDKIYLEYLDKMNKHHFFQLKNAKI